MGEAIDGDPCLVEWRGGDVRRRWWADRASTGGRIMPTMRGVLTLLGNVPSIGKPLRLQRAWSRAFHGTRVA
jgi:hypothetical protein